MPFCAYSERHSQPLGNMLVADMLVDSETISHPTIVALSTFMKSQSLRQRGL